MDTLQPHCPTAVYGAGVLCSAQMEGRQDAHILQASSLHPHRNSEEAKLRKDTQLGSLQTLVWKVQLRDLGRKLPNLLEPGNLFLKMEARSREIELIQRFDKDSG